MKKILPILLVTVFLLSSCSIDWNDEKDKRISEVEKQNMELKSQLNIVIFEKQKECLTYNQEISNLLKMVVDMKASFGLQKYDEFDSEILEDIFYSPKHQSCLYSVKKLKMYWKNEAIGEGTCESYYVYDFLTQSHRTFIEAIHPEFVEVPWTTTMKCDNSNVTQKYKTLLKQLWWD